MRAVITSTRAARAVTALLMLLPVLAAGGAGAQSIDEVRGEKDQLEAEQEAIQEQAAIVGQEIDALEADVAQLTAILRGYEAEVAQTGEEAAAAERRAGFAADRVSLARIEERKAQDEERALREQVREYAVGAYVRPPDTDLVASLAQGDWLEGTRRTVLLDAISDRDRQVVDSYRAIREDLTLRRQAAEDAVAEAERLAREAAAAAAAAEDARFRQESFVLEVVDRLDHALAEAASLEAIDAELAAEIRARENTIAELIAAAAAAAAARNSAGNRPAIPPPSEITNASGIYVHQSIAPQVSALLAEAAGAGIILGGGGWRSNESQISLRRSHCGSSDYAVWDAPSSACRPPTARPGASMHERGLAVDFTANGRAITSRSSDAFQWLAANAGRFGLYNLPSEPWHWSTNGQ